MNLLKARITGRRDGSVAELIVHVAVDVSPVLTEEVREAARDTREEINRCEHATVVGRFDARSRVGVDDPIELAVDTGRLLFFDQQTGTALAA